MTRPAFLKSRAGARWLLTFIVASTICFVIYVYRSDANHIFLQSLLPDTDTDPSTHSEQDQTSTLSPEDPSSPPGALLPAQHTRPPWISTPAVFDTTKVPGYVAPSSSSLPDRPLALHPLLSSAMANFLSRPVLTHSQATPQNEAACPRSQLNSQVNADQLAGEQASWVSVDAERIVAMRRGALEYLEGHSAAEGEDALVGPGRGHDGQSVVRGSRGVVLAAGNHRTVDKAIVCIREMKKLGWRDVVDGGIEVFHFEGEMTDDGQRRQLEELGVTVRMVSTKKAPGQWKNFELKAESILRSSFDEVLYLDSDNFPLSNPADLFESRLFRDPAGGNAVFWPDLNRDHPDNAIHRLLGIPCHEAWELDSGQVLIAKSGNGGLNLAALYLAQYMAEDGSYWFSGGDKDTFLLLLVYALTPHSRYAFLALGIPYTPAPRWLSLLGNLDRRNDNFCGAAMLQYGLSPPRPGSADPSDPSHPPPLFVHANLLKHQGGVRPGGVFTLLRRLSPLQDDVRAEYAPATALHSVAGSGKAVAGRGLCSEIRAFRGGAEVETVDARGAFGGAMEGLEEEYFGYPGTRPGVWR
ncbi:hypothetical protein SLS53_006888 [Cytospora paraplurivora]|uniref:Uncharacterized protein n=1 Tax=Cytospora paraplurivora TaxID=2898453 RepID=A0AAN9UAA9_9PEZI